MSKSDVAENDVLKLHTGQAATATYPITPWLALLTAQPSDEAGTGLTASARARVDTTGLWAAPSGGSVSNNAEIAFASVGSQETITGAALYDASTGGNLIRIVDVPDKVVAANDVPRFAAGQLTFSED